MEFPKILLDKISFYLIDRNETISIAESVTSGFVQLAFSQMPNAEQFFRGGLTAYTLEEKVKLLGINQEEAESVNCVSMSITEAMALGVAEKFGTDWSIATTGYATPVLESGEEIFAYYSISYLGEIVLSDKIELHPLTKSIDAQNYFTECILSSLRCEVKKNVLQLAFKN
jgi:nicotinamide-nucleotide amidase